MRNKIQTIGERCAFVRHKKGGYVSILKQANQYWFTDSINKGMIRTMPGTWDLKDVITNVVNSNNVRRCYSGTERFEQERNLIVSEIQWNSIRDCYNTDRSNLNDE